MPEKPRHEPRHGPRDDRRYDEAEVRDIFEHAARDEGTDPHLPATRAGLTLDELQEVGREVGLSPERVARAAAALDSRPGAVRRETSVGAPVRVERIVELPRAPTEREWQVLVAELRQGRDAAGRMISRGETREWSDGRLHVFVEPSATGHQLRLTARRRDEIEVVWLGGLAALLGLVLLVTSGLDAGTFGAVWETLLPAILAALGLGSLGSRTLRLRRWADGTEREMARIAGRARALLEAPENGSGDAQP